MEARIRKVISSHQNNPRHRRRVNKLRWLVPAPLPELKLEPVVMPYLRT